MDKSKNIFRCLFNKGFRTSWLINLFCSIFIITNISSASSLSVENNNSSLFPLSIIHINDFHARYEPTDINGDPCPKKSKSCIGGYARVIHTVKRLAREQRKLHPLFLNAGDNFQGTIWYNVGLWNVTTELFNILPPHAITLGNHEFDDGIDGVVPFMKELYSSFVVTNMEPYQLKEISESFVLYHIIKNYERKVGVLGVIMENVHEISRTGTIFFYNEIKAIKMALERLKYEGISIIIVLSHCGYEVDKIIAQETGDDVDLIVGGHSHTFLYSGKPVPGPDKPAGPYPTVVESKNGNKVLIVQAGAYAKYVGNLIVYFDENNKIVKYEGNPIYMSSDIPQDEEVKKALIPWKKIIDKKGNVVLGKALIDFKKDLCDHEECNLGNFYCDAVLHSIAAAKTVSDTWTQATICLVNNGGLRTSLKQGNITYANLITLVPFQNAILVYDIPGKELKNALEFAVNTINLEKNINTSRTFLQVAGLKVQYDFLRPSFDRVVDLKVLCRFCSLPKYEDFDPETLYRIATPSFLQNGGDGFTMLKEFATNIRYYSTDTEALTQYLSGKRAIYQGIEGRIITES